MTTATVVYLGGLRSQCTHTSSGTTIYTDAPIDNKGKGQAFSPTDLCSLGLATCIITSMGIYAEEHNINLAGATGNMTKLMQTNPRSIAKILLHFTIPEKDLDQEHKDTLERIAITCPAYLSLHPSVEKIVQFTWI